MSHAVQPPILNLQCEEHAAGPKHPPDFRKGAILQLARTQMMKHQDRNRRRKRAIRKRQRPRIALDHCCIRAIHTGAQLCRKCVVVLETRHTRRPQAQLSRRRSRPCAELQHMLA